MDYRETMAVYIVRLEKRTNRMALELAGKTREKAREIEGLTDIREQIQAFKGYEPGYDRKAKELETTRDIFDELKSIFDSAI